MLTITTFVFIITSPTSDEYFLYLTKSHGIDCYSFEASNCIHTKNELMSSKQTHLLFFMKAETSIFGEKDNKIRVVGLLNHFFVLENSLHQKT